jgi:hypothetical protein
LCLIFILYKQTKYERNIEREMIKKTIIFNKRKDKYDQCPICLKDYIDNEKIEKLKCGHLYHHGCIDFMD